VVERLGSWLRSPSKRNALFDGLVVASVLLVAAIDFPSGADERDAKWVAAAGLTSAVMLARRTAPLATAAGVMALFAAVHRDDPLDDPPFQFLAMLIASFALGAHATSRRGAVGFALIAASFTALNAIRGETVPSALAGCLLFLGAFAFGLTVRRASRRERMLEQQAREAVAEERERIARDLHDAVGHSVSVMVLQVGAVRRRLTEGQGEEREALRTAERAGRQAVVELQRMLGMLRRREDDALAPLPSLARVPELVETIEKSGVPVELKVEGRSADLPPGVEVAAYRIVQEALTNVLKHAGEASARVLVRHERDAVTLEVSDDGSGASPNGHGHGLIGMRERVALYGGSLDAGPRPGGGFIVRAMLPVEWQSE